jgi:hypothetical protein
VVDALLLALLLAYAVHGLRLARKVRKQSDVDGRERNYCDVSWHYIAVSLALLRPCMQACAVNTVGGVQGS